MSRRSAMERFEDKVERIPFHACWEWIGSKSGDGYGRFWNGRGLVNAHRWSYEDRRGEIPDGLELDHLCRNRSCVNPWHLEPVTKSENLRRSPVFMERAARLGKREHDRKYDLPRGVYYNKHRGKFYARGEIVAGRFSHLGTFDTALEAAEAKAKHIAAD